jgi:hypothetical protein
MEKGLITKISGEGLKMSDYIYLERECDELNYVYAAKPEWFEEMKEHDLYDQYGQQIAGNHEPDPNDADSELCHCCTVRAYNYVIGSNWHSVIIESEGADPEYTQVTNPERIAKFDETLANLGESTRTRTGFDDWQTAEFDIEASQWESHWWLYRISKRDEEAAANA